MAKIIIALGGNALGNTPEEQLELVRQTAKPIADLVESGNQVIICHGNGPQVGMINLGMSSAAESGVIAAEMPLPECGAMSQGYIGYHLQNSITNELASRNIQKDVATVVTQVVVDENDPSFQNPTKPIGSFYSKERADELVKEKGFTMVEDAGRGYRQVVASPKPVDVVEKNVIGSLVENGNIVIACGGGGIPVIKKDGMYRGIPAVVDKDFASAKLAELLGADILIILTAVERVAVNWGKENQEWLSEMSIEEAKRYCEEGQFAPGSMLPKVQAAIAFASTGGTAIIADLSKAKDAISGLSGTKVHP